MTSETAYTSGSISINAGIYLCYVSINAVYPNSGITNIEGCEIYLNGSNFTGGSTREPIKRTVIWGTGYTYALFNGFISSVTVTSTATLTCSYKPYFTFTSSAAGIEASSSNVSFIRIA